MKLGVWLAWGELHVHPWRALAALAAIALGVAMGLAVQLINASAIGEFTQAVRATTGQADLEVRGPRNGFADTVLDLVAADPAVAVASPLLEVDATVLSADGPRVLKLIGVDLFRASRVTPELIGQPADGDGLALLADDAVFLSPAAAAWLSLSAGDVLRIGTGLAEVQLRVAGELPGARPGQRIATLDLGAAQWRLDRLGKLTRIALRLRPGSDLAAVQARLAARLPAGVFIAPPADAEVRASNLSRAYRVNLNVLALVALFTGAFLVYTTQSLAVVRRRGEFALLRALGWPARRLLRHVLAEGALLGLAGSLLGAVLGVVVATTVLRLFGGDLGGGYFAGIAPALRIDAPTVAAFIVLGTLAAVGGSLAPAREIARTDPARALKSGDIPAAGLGRPRWAPGVSLLAIGAGLLLLPPFGDIPVGGYLAIACWLVGGILLMPALAAHLFTGLAARASRTVARSPLWFLSTQRLAAAPGQAGIALAGIVASFALMVAMGVMVGSFRDSVGRWLDRVLAAPLYFRVPAGGNSSYVPAAVLAEIEASPLLARAEWMRIAQLDLDPRRPAVTLMARHVNKQDPAERIPLTGPALSVASLPAGVVPVWVSEAMVDLYGWRLGTQQTLPLAGQPVAVVVAGVWRDFARQHGAVTLDLADYRRLTGDWGITDGALWPKPGVSAGELAAALRRQIAGTEQLEFAEPGEIRSASLRIFDRSFAVTYLLELVAIGIGLAGIAASFSAQTLARAREFGMLRHLGLARRQLMRLLALEATGLTLLGILAGGVLGFAIALVLIHVVNPQSFHWKMDLAPPWSLLGSVATLLLGAGVATALLATRRATGSGPLRAVREDW